MIRSFQSIFVTPALLRRLSYPAVGGWLLFRGSSRASLTLPSQAGHSR